jgi:hypothetical protein
MASISNPRIYGFSAGGAIALGKAVKIGADSKHVAVASAASDKMLGIAQSDATNAEDEMEVALPGGGAKALAGGNISAGDLLTSDGSGKLIATTSNADRYIAMAMESAVLNDLFAVEVIAGIV